MFLRLLIQNTFDLIFWKFLFQFTIGNKLNTETTQPKLRKGIKSQNPHRATRSISIVNNNHTRVALPKRPNQDSLQSQTNPLTKMPNNVTKHFVSTASCGDSSFLNHNSTFQNQVIQRYLNQSMPVRIQHDRGTSYQFRNVSHNQTFIPNAENQRFRSASTRSQTVKNNLRHSAVPKPATATQCSLRSWKNFSQNHGVISASVYKDLRNGNIRW